MYSLVSILYIVYPRIAQTMYFWDCYLDQTDYKFKTIFDRYVEVDIVP
jgi:hypothetical protein